MFVCLFVCLFALACEENNETARSIQNEKLSEVPIKVKDGSLCFSNLEDYSKTLNALSDFTEEEYNQWQRNLGFTSMESSYRMLLVELENAASYEEFLAILDANKDVATLVDDAVTPVIQLSHLRLVLSRTGVIYIGKQAIMYDSNYKYATSIENSKELISKTILDSKNGKVEKYKYIATSKVLEPIVCATYSSNTVRNADGDRKAELVLRKYSDPHSGYVLNGQPASKVVSGIVVNGRALKKNFWGKFVEYKTDNELRYSFAARLNNTNSLPVWFSGNETNSNRVNIGFNKELFNDIVAEDRVIEVDVLFEFIHLVSYYHQGMQGEWCELNTCH